MSGYKAELRASAQDAEYIAALAGELLDPPPAVSLREDRGGWIVELYLDEKPGGGALAALSGVPGLPDELKHPDFQPLPSQDWVALTQQGLHPIRAGRFFVHGSHDRHLRPGRQYAIEVDAGQAFGTAHHGTTRGCLTMIDRIAKQRGASRVLDFGTGSGILAIAAAKTLSFRIMAADIDPVAVTVAADNFRLNEISSRAVAVCASRPGDPAIAGGKPYNVILANILAGPLIALAPGFRELTAAGSDLILSGLLNHQAREVRACYLAQGFRMAAALSIEGWSTLHLRRAI